MRINDPETAVHTGDRYLAEISSHVAKWNRMSAQVDDLGEYIAANEPILLGRLDDAFEHMFRNETLNIEAINQAAAKIEQTDIDYFAGMFIARAAIKSTQMRHLVFGMSMIESYDTEGSCPEGELKVLKSEAVYRRRSEKPPLISSGRILERGETVSGQIAVLSTFPEAGGAIRLLDTSQLFSDVFRLVDPLSGEPNVELRLINVPNPSVDG